MALAQCTSGRWAASPDSASLLRMTKPAPSVFDVYEEFVDRAPFDAHQARVKESSWGACTKGLVQEYTITDASTPSA